MKIKIEHYLTLFKDCDEYIVDLREDTIDENDDPIYEEYIEGFIFEKYDEALAKYHELEEKYRDTKGGILAEREEETNSLNHMFGDVSKDLDKLTIKKN